jgi:hypothetical protein
MTDGEPEPREFRHHVLDPAASIDAAKFFRFP